jgi:hypothetical protein
MNKHIVMSGAILLAGLAAISAWAATSTLGAAGATIPAAEGWKRSVHIEWGYTHPADLEVTGFKLYKDGAPACTFTGGTTSQGDCEVTLTRSGTAFTLTAAFADGTESPHSAPFVFSDFGPGPKIIILVGK